MATSAELMFDHDHLKVHEPKESEKTVTLLSDTGAPSEVPIKMFTRSPSISNTARDKLNGRAMLGLHASKDYGACRFKQRKLDRTGNLLVGSRLISHATQKQAQTGVTAGSLSDLPTFDSYNSNNPSKKITARTKTTANVRSPGDGLELTHNRRVPKHNDSGSPPLSSCSLPCSHSMVSLSKTPLAKNNFTQINSSPDTQVKEFTPVITDDFDDETYRFQCSCPGLYQCSVSGLVFNMKGEGDVLYRTVPWNRRLLAQNHKKPAGPLFDIKCLQQSVCQLHLPHCEISTGGTQSLQVAHVSDEGVEFIGPHQVTQTHVVLNISGFSAYGNVKDEDSPPDPVRALVLLFYKPPEDPDLRSVLSVLMLPRNIVIRDVQRTRRKLIGDERYIDTSPHCNLHPKQSYTLSTSPEDDLIKVQPKEAEFDDEYHESYFPSFQVILKEKCTEIILRLKHKSSSKCVWGREVCLFSPKVETMNLPPSQRLFTVRSCFIESVSGPVLSSLLDQLLEKKVITEGEREEADGKQPRGEKARVVIDTVRKKGEAASSEMIEFLSKNDHILCQHLGLI